ncbi:MAG: hypothetical protein RLY58_308 [Pseudomonadota bacterium]|jgi:hypothetical protein
MPRQPHTALSAALTVIAALYAGTADASITSYSATNNATQLIYKLVKNSTYNQHRVYLDTDQTPATGFNAYGIGANYLLENGNLYSYSGTGSNWSWTLAKAVSYSVTATAVQWTLARADVGETASPNAANVVFQAETPLDTQPVYTHTYSTYNTVNYTNDTTTILANPERGLYHSNGGCNYDAATLQGYLTNEKISLVLCSVDLGAFKTSAISQNALDTLNQNLATIRQAGLKAIVRFAYSWDGAAVTQPNTRDTTKAWMLSHISQLAPYLQSNADVITTVQTGLIGVWGEWYYTDYFGNEGQISATQWLDRQDVTQALLNALPSNRTVQLRTPAFKQHFYGTAALTSAEAFQNTDKARVGHHNDCFLANADDFGTYADVTADKNYLNTDNLYVPQGGETCTPSTYSTWTNANADMSKMHYSYLNADYNTDVLNSWGSNLSIAKRKLGYRFNMVQGVYSNQVAVGGTLSFSLKIANSGYASPYNARKAMLILRNTSTGTLYRFALTSDPRRWLAAQTTQLSQAIKLVGVPAGSYSLLLHLPDAANGLSNRPEYAIRMANTSGWESTTGFNALNHVLVVQ